MEVAGPRDFEKERRESEIMGRSTGFDCQRDAACESLKKEREKGIGRESRESENSSDIRKRRIRKL